MSYSALKLITRSWFLSGIVARNLQSVTGDQANQGLDLLNSLLDFKQIEIDLVPYYTYITLPCVSGQEFYFLPYVSEIETSTFNIDVVRYPMMLATRANYYGSPRVDNITTLPFSYNFNRALGGGNLALYFKPNSTYPLKLMVKLFLQDVNLNTDLTNFAVTGLPYTFVNSNNQGFDTSYIEYLRYALAQYMCSEYGIQFNPESAKILQRMERKLMYISPPDLSMQKITVLDADRPGVITWGFVNLSGGWVPS